PYNSVTSDMQASTELGRTTASTGNTNSLSDNAASSLEKPSTEAGVPTGTSPSNSVTSDMQASTELGRTTASTGNTNSLSDNAASSLKDQSKPSKSEKGTDKRKGGGLFAGAMFAPHTSGNKAKLVAPPTTPAPTPRLTNRHSAA
ncbi:MAG: hypothetical protein OEY79_03365, partial [Anaplasmataceae bacterium]|nr:hypothetical protein [Anaplasmataceae bacterium]